MNQIANTIAAQIGGRAFVMMGTRQKVATERSLIFDVRGSREVNKIQITLAGDDTYTVAFWKVARKAYLPDKKVKELDGIYFDQLHEVIERTTGLYLSL